MMENYFISLFEDVRCERILILVLSLTDENILKQSGFTEEDVKTIKNIALNKIHRQRTLKDYKAVEFMGSK